MWLHVREVQILTAIATLWAATIGMVGLKMPLDAPSAFFVGYGVDSFIDLFLKRFAVFTSSGVDRAQAGLKGEGAK